MKKRTCLVLSLLLLGMTSCSKKNSDDLAKDPDPTGKSDVLSEIADPVFKAYLQRDLSTYDLDHDGKLSPDEASKIRSISVNGNHADTKIKSLEGIQYFTGLAYLDCADQNLSILDLSKNLKLTELNCASNVLTKLDIKDNAGLTRLVCNNNKLQQLDLVDKVALGYLNCADNQLDVLDMSTTKSLVELFCQNNKLTKLLLPSFNYIKKLHAYNNELVSLDVQRGEELAELRLGNNRLQELDISQCNSNLLKTLDAEKNPQLATLYVTKLFDKNLLFLLNLPEGVRISVRHHPGEGRDITQAIGNVGLAQYIRVSISKELATYDTDEYKGVLSAAEAAAVSRLIVSGLNLAGIDGIEYFTGLTYLDFSANRIKSNRFVSLTNNPRIQVLICSDNAIPEIDLSANHALERLDCSSNKLSKLLLQENRELTVLSCGENPLEELDISNNQKLRELSCMNSPTLKKIYVWKGFDRTKLTRVAVDEGVVFVER